MHWLDPDRYHAELTATVAVTADVLRSAGPAHPVPTCPGWTMADLAGHVGAGLHWSAGMVRDRATGPAPRSDVLAPADDLATWIVDAAAALTTAVADVGADAEVWTWSPDRTAGFWLRRMTHDMLVHQLDAELAVGRDPIVAPDLAADGVSDLLNCFAVISTSGFGFAELRGSGQTLHFHATDDGLGPAGEWFVRRTPTGVEWEHGHLKADTAVRGPARDLLLTLNRRTPPDHVEVLGDQGLFTHWQTHSAF